MHLDIVRHGQAGESGTGKDRDRELTSRGRLQAAYVGEVLKREGTPPRIIASGYRRTRQTAETIGQEIGVVAEFDPRLELGTASEALEVIVEARELGPTVVVGHQPQLCALLAVLMHGPGGGKAIPLRTGEAYRLDLPDAGEIIGRSELRSRIQWDGG